MSLKPFKSIKPFMSASHFLCIAVLLAFGWFTLEETAFAQTKDKGPLDEAAIEAELQRRIAVDTALRMIKTDRVQEGIESLSELGQKGNGLAFFHLAEFYRLGIDGTKSLDLSMMYYRLASALGHDRSSLSLANLLYFEKAGDAKSAQTAIAIWQQQAMLGKLEAIYMLGMLYWNGDGGLQTDPVRGYGLVWRAVQEGYRDAFESEAAMLPMLSLEARRVGRDYATKLAEFGFTEDPIAMDLVVANVVTAAPGVQAREAPDDWNSVWVMEIGFGMSKEEAETLKKTIFQTQGELLQEFTADLVKSSTRAGLYKVIIGPMEGMREAVTVCVGLKQAGNDCFARPPD